MARGTTFILLALFSEASLASSNPLLHRQVDGSILLSSLKSAALSTGLTSSSLASGSNASSAFPSITLSNSAGISGPTTGVPLSIQSSSFAVGSSSTLISLTAVSKTTASDESSSAFPTISVSSNSGLTGSGTGTTIRPISTAVGTSALTSQVSTLEASIVSPSLDSIPGSGLTRSVTESIIVPITSSVASDSVTVNISSSRSFPSLSLSSDSGLTSSGIGTSSAIPVSSSVSSSVSGSFRVTTSSSISSLISLSSQKSSTSSELSSSFKSSSGKASSGQTASITSPIPTSAPASTTETIVTPSTTITSLPTGAKVESITGSVQWTDDDWITTTASGDSTPTVVPIIFPVISGTPAKIPVIIWGGITPPSINPPAIQLKTPELGCIQFLGIKIGNCPDDSDPKTKTDGSEPSKSNPKSSDRSSEASSSSSSCSGKTATVTTVECSSAGTSSSCETKTSETVGCSVTGGFTSTGSCIASTTIASSKICCSSTSVSSGKTVCAFETMTGIAVYPSPTAKQISLGTAKLLSILGDYYSSYGASSNGTTKSSSSFKSSSTSSASLPASTTAGNTTATSSSARGTSTASSRSSGGTTPLSTFITSTKSSSSSSNATTTSGTTPAPVCMEGNNSLMGVNNEPASWCFCGGRGPFSTVDKARTNYCNFTALPTQTISLTSHSTSIDTACHVTKTLDTAVATTTMTYCQCGNVIAGIGTSTISGGTKLVGCQLSPTWSIISTITPTPTPTRTPTPTPVSPYADAGGQCHIHVNEYQACAEETQDLEAEITMWDVKGSQIGYQDLIGINANGPLKMKSKLEDLLEVTGEHKGNYLQFTLGSESWTSKDNDKSSPAYCNTGGWDPREDPWSDPFFECKYGSLIRQRQMDCYFQCPWHGGKSSDA